MTEPGWKPGDGRCSGPVHDERGQVCCGGPDRLVCGVGRVGSPVIRRALERVDRAAPFAPPAAGLDRLSTWLRTVQAVPEKHRSAGEAVALALLGEDQQARRLTASEVALPPPVVEYLRKLRGEYDAVAASPAEPMDAYPLEEMCRCGHAWAGHDSLPPHECMADGYRCPVGTCTVFRPQRSAPPPRADGTYGYRTGRNPLDRCGPAGGVGDPDR